MYSWVSIPNLASNKFYNMKEIKQQKYFFLGVFFLISLIQPALAYTYFIANEKQFISILHIIFIFYCKEKMSWFVYFYLMSNAQETLVSHI